MLHLHGVITALATPFKDGALDQETYASHINSQLESGVSGLCPIGTTGEAATMSAEERRRAVEIAVLCADGEVPVVAGAGANSTAETIRNVAMVRDAGADAALVVTPYYNKPTQEGLLAHYRAIVAAHPGFPLVAYNVPGRTGVDLLPDTVRRLADIPEIVGLKEATGSIQRLIDILELVGTERFSLLSGDDFTALPFVEMGGRGVISVSSNIVPDFMAAMLRLAQSGDLKTAARFQVKLCALHRALFSESNPIPVKAALFETGRFGPEIRLPLTPMSAQKREILKNALRALGVPLA